MDAGGKVWFLYWAIIRIETAKDTPVRMANLDTEFSVRPLNNYYAFVIVPGALPYLLLSYFRYCWATVSAILWWSPWPEST